MLRRTFSRLCFSSSPAALTLYAHPVSQPSRAVSWLLALERIEHNYERLSPIDGDTLTDDYMRKFPLGALPAISDRLPFSFSSENDNQKRDKASATKTGNVIHVAEASAILQYICETRKLDKWYPAFATSQHALLRRTKIHEYLSWHHGALRPCTDDCFRYLMLQFMRKNNMNISTSPFLPTAKFPTGMTREQVDKFLNRLSRGAIEDMIFNSRWHEVGDDAGGVFLAPGGLSIADLLAYCELDQLDMLGLLVGIRREKPLFDRWMTAMAELPYHDQVRKPLKKLVAGIKMTTPEMF